MSLVFSTQTFFIIFLLKICICMKYLIDFWSLTPVEIFIGSDIQAPHIVDLWSQFFIPENTNNS